MFRRRRHLAPGATGFAAVLLAAPLGLSTLRGARPKPSGTATLQLLGVNDLHGHLEPVGRKGGFAWLKTTFDRAEARYRGRR